MTHDMVQNCMENLTDFFLIFFLENLHRKFENIKKLNMRKMGHMTHHIDQNWTANLMDTIVTLADVVLELKSCLGVKFTQVRNYGPISAYDHSYLSTFYADFTRCKNYTPPPV